MTHWRCNSILMKTFALVCAVLLSSGCKQTLYGDLGEQEANEMLAILLDHCISAEKQPGKKGRVILDVEKSQINVAVNALKNNGYPKEARFQNLGSFDDSGMITSPAQEQAKQIHQMSQELSYTLITIDGVVDARAHIVLAEEDKLGRHVSPASVGILIKHVSGVNMQRHISRIKSLVQRGVPGVELENISIALVEAEETAGDTRYSLCDQADESASLLSSLWFWAVMLVLLFGTNVGLYVYVTRVKPNHNRKRSGRA